MTPTNAFTSFPNPSPLQSNTSASPSAHSSCTLSRTQPLPTQQQQHLLLPLSERIPSPHPPQLRLNYLQHPPPSARQCHFTQPNTAPTHSAPFALFSFLPSHPQPLTTPLGWSSSHQPSSTRLRTSTQPLMPASRSRTPWQPNGQAYTSCLELPQIRGSYLGCRDMWRGYVLGGCWETTSGGLG